MSVRDCNTLQVRESIFTGAHQEYCATNPANTSTTDSYESVVFFRVK